MSAIVQQAKLHYRKVLIIELILISAVSFLCFLLKKSVAVSLLLGFLSAFLPYLCFVYCVFFSRFSTNTHKMKPFYWGEGIKWITTIILITVIFITYKSIDFIAFFIGYFVILMTNIVLPIIVKSNSK